MALAFLPTSNHDGAFDVFLNAVELQRSELTSLLAGSTVVFDGAEQLIGAGNYADGDAMDITDLTWYRVRTALLHLDPDGTSTLTLGLRTVEEAAVQSDETVVFRGLIQVACRPASGQQDPQFASPFCSSFVEDMPELAALVD